VTIRVLHWVRVRVRLWLRGGCRREPFLQFSPVRLFVVRYELGSVPEYYFVPKEGKTRLDLIRNGEGFALWASNVMHLYLRLAQIVF
jgi:hypothetical protein